MIFNSHFEYDNVIETFVRVHEELVYSICSRTRSPRLWDVNPFSAKDVLLDFTLSNARRFYSSKGNPLALKGLKNYLP